MEEKAAKLASPSKAVIGAVMLGPVIGTAVVASGQLFLPLYVGAGLEFEHMDSSRTGINTQARWPFVGFPGTPPKPIM